MTLYILLLTLTLLQVKVTSTYSENYKGPNMAPKIIVAGKINILDDVTIRCESQNGDFCYFYKDPGIVHFKTVEYNTHYNLCQFHIPGEHLVEKLSLESDTEVFLSCAVGLNSTGRIHLSQRSEMKRMVVLTDPFVVRITTEKDNIAIEESIRVRCEAQRGTRCHLYTSQSESPIRTEIFRSRVCMVSLTGKEMLAKSVNQSEVTEIELSCAVELKKDNNEVISSARSKRVKVIVSGWEVKNTQPPSTVTHPTVGGDDNNNKSHRGLLFWSLTAGLSLLMVAGVLIILYLKYKNNNNTERTEPQGTDTIQLYSIISQIPIDHSQNHMQEEHPATEVCYAAVVRPKTRKLDSSPEDEYSNVVYSWSQRLDFHPKTHSSATVEGRSHE